MVLYAHANATTYSRRDESIDLNRFLRDFIALSKRAHKCLLLGMCMRTGEYVFPSFWSIKLNPTRNKDENPFNKIGKNTTIFGTIPGN